MAGNIACGRRVRKDFSKIPSIVEIPNLIEIQQQSYEQFLQKDVASEKREEMGLQAVFKSVFPIADYNGNATLEFHSYHFGDPKYTVEECHDRGMTFAIPLKVTLRLKVVDNDKETKTQTIREVREQEVYLGELPLMTEKGTFIINGTERVVVSQLQRSAGVFFDDDKGKTVASGKLLFSARVIPYRGSWVEFEFDANEILYVRVDRRRKMLATAFLRAFWFLEKGVILSDEEILGLFYETEEVQAFEDRLAWVKLNGLAGYIDHSGAFVIQPTFDDAYQFSQGLAAVRVGSNFGYIKPSGEYVIEPKFAFGEAFSEGLASVMQLNAEGLPQYGYINAAGEVVIPLLGRRACG